MGLKIRSDINPTPSRETTYRTISTKGVKGVSSVTKTRVSTGLPNQTSTKCCRRITVEHHRAAPTNTFMGTPLVSEKYRSSSPRGKANTYDLIGRMTLPSIGKRQSKREEVVTLTAMSAQKAFRRVSQLNCGALCCLLLCLFMRHNATTLAIAMPHVIPSWTGWVDDKLGKLIFQVPEDKEDESALLAVSCILECMKGALDLDHKQRLLGS